jgi:maltooligosyltrehalose trehalohydrolase
LSAHHAITRRFPFGAEIDDGGARFHVWAPARRTVEVVFVSGERRELRRHPLVDERDGFFSAHVSDVRAGALYFYRLDDDPQNYPDPASRFQPQGVHGPSQVIDPNRFAWDDANWPGVKLAGQILYELHIGTFTPEGTWAAAVEKLPLLRDVGITLIELMPVAAFPGKFGWGYDGTYWFAPSRQYGEPDDFRAFVNHAHRLGIGVILDVVYNHFGPSGNYMAAFSSAFNSQKHTTEWGDALNFDDEHSVPVRDFVAANAAHWIREYHLDGLRLDAIQSIEDDSDEHIVTQLTREARRAADARTILVFAENERQEAHGVLPAEEGGWGLDGLWNDDFHHSCRIAATGKLEGYYGDYRGTPQELLLATRFGYLYQGQRNRRQGKIRGTPAVDIPAPHFVHFLQNHDQVANSARSVRTHLLTSPGRHRALTALLLLGPQTPLLFMGQEFSASNPFHYFADHEPELAALVRRGRREFMGQFPSIEDFETGSELPDPAAVETFLASQLDWREREQNEAAVKLHRDLIRLRKEDPVFLRQDKSMIEGSVIGPEALLLRWYDAEGDDRLAMINLGHDLDRCPPADPLLAPPLGRRWQILWSSEDSSYGGSGTPELDEKQFRVTGHAAVILQAVVA